MRSRSTPSIGRGFRGKVDEKDTYPLETNIIHFLVYSGMCLIEACTENLGSTYKVGGELRQTGAEQKGSRRKRCRV